MEKTKDLFEDKGWTGKLIAWGYYKADKNCTVEYDGNKETDLKYVSKSLAWHIYNNYTSKGKTVDVVAHSMGGLVIRNAIARVKRGHAGFPPKLYASSKRRPSTPGTRSGTRGRRLRAQRIPQDGGRRQLRLLPQR